MNTEPFDEFESQLAAVRRNGAPAALRSAVLNDVDRELRASRWDRRLMRAAILLLVIGVGFNTALVLTDSTQQSAARLPGALATAPARSALLETAVVISESTDAATGRRFAEKWAAYSGRELTAQELEALDSLATRDRG
jgi:hypothetical protein